VIVAGMAMIYGIFLIRQFALSMYTRPVALANLTGEHVQDTELMMAGAVMTILPVMIIFIALQKYSISGIMASGLKE
jgi:multiple sugar transport system permease protein